MAAKKVGFVNIALSHTVSEINAFYEKIQDGRQKWWEKIFWQKVTDDTVCTLAAKTVSHCFRDIIILCIFPFYTEIQKDHQKWKENSAHKNLVKSLCLTIFEINTIFHFTQKFKVAAKNGEKMVCRPLYKHNSMTVKKQTRTTVAHQTLHKQVTFYILYLKRTFLLSYFLNMAHFHPILCT